MTEADQEDSFFACDSSDEEEPRWISYGHMQAAAAAGRRRQGCSAQFPDPPAIDGQAAGKGIDRVTDKGKDKVKGGAASSSGEAAVAPPSEPPAPPQMRRKRRAVAEAEEALAPTVPAAPPPFPWQMTDKDLCTECKRWHPYEPKPLIMPWCRFCRQENVHHHGRCCPLWCAPPQPPPRPQLQRQQQQPQQQQPLAQQQRQQQQPPQQQQQPPPQPQQQQPPALEEVAEDVEPYQATASDEEWWRTASMGQPSYAGYGMGDYSYSSHGTTSEEDGKAAADEERDRHKKTKERSIDERVNEESEKVAAGSSQQEVQCGPEDSEATGSSDRTAPMKPRVQCGSKAGKLGVQCDLKREDPAPPSEAEFRLQRLRARVMQKAEQAMDDIYICCKKRARS